LADAYATIANRGFLLAPSIVKAIWAPLTPDASPAVADLSKGKVVERFDAPVVRKQLAMPGNVLLPIWNGMHRVTHGPGVTYHGFYHGTTGQSLFQSFPVDIAGKTGTAQGAASLPWNDSSVFGAFSEQDDLPYTVVSYLEKSGYGAKAAAPVTKCMFLALGHKTATDPVLVSNPLDLNSTEVAPMMKLKDTGCLGITGDLGRG
jgi:penicillin-binding protein 2